MSTDNDILEYMPDLNDYGIQGFSDEHAKTRNDILRRLRIEWYPRHRGHSSSEMDVSKLTESQFTRVAVFHVLSYYILPKLTQFTTDGDRFQVMLDFYKGRYEEEFNLILRDGIEYDEDGDSTVTDSEKAPEVFLKLER
jgi:hypothetical protein